MAGSRGSTVLSLLDGQCLALNLRRGEIVIEQCNGGRTQQWRMEGEFFKSSHDGRCLDFAFHHGLDHLVAWTCHAGLNQRWYIQGNSIRSRQDNRCLARYGNFVRVSHCNLASRGQQWSFQKTRPPVTPPGRDCCSTCSQFGKAFCSPQSGRCYDFQAMPHYQKCGIQPPVNHNCCTKCGPFGKGFCSPQSGRCYDFQAKPHYQKCGVSPPVGPPVTHPVHAGPVLSLLDGQCLALNLRRGEIVIEQCNGASTQQWRMEGEFFKSSHDGRCLDFAFHHGLDHLVAWTCHAGLNQRWYIQGNSIRSRQDNRCLARYGNFVRVSHCNLASRGQQWSFQKTRPPVTPPGGDCCSTCSH